VTRKDAIPRLARGKAKSSTSLRPFVEVVPAGIEPDSLEDKKLRFTRRLQFIARRWRNLLDEALRDGGDSYARWLALLWIDLLDGKANHRELAERVGVELPTLVRLLNRLEEERLVKRRSLGTKGRAKAVVLTEKGRERLAVVARIVTQTRADFLAGVDEKKLVVALELLDAVLAKYVTVVERGARGRAT
jgi:MarR family transcriptional regulator for hemolysin